MWLYRQNQAPDSHPVRAKLWPCIAARPILATTGSPSGMTRTWLCRTANVAGQMQAVCLAQVRDVVSTSAVAQASILSRCPHSAGNSQALTFLPTNCVSPASALRIAGSISSKGTLSACRSMTGHSTPWCHCFRTPTLMISRRSCERWRESCGRKACSSTWVCIPVLPGRTVRRPALPSRSCTLDTAPPGATPPGQASHRTVSGPRSAACTSRSARCSNRFSTRD